MTEDVIIIGGGVMGASAAYWLTRFSPGLRVLVVERDPGYERAATALSVASVRQQFSSAVNVRISRFGIDFIRNFAERIGPAAEIPSLGLKENGYLFLTTRPEQVAVMQELAEMQRAEGAATEVWDAAELGRHYPWLNTEDIAAASFGPRDEGWFDNMGLLQGFRNAARAQGAKFIKAEATGLQMTAGRVTGVEIEGRGLVPCGVAINAAGTRASRVMAWAGLDHPVEPRKRTVFVIDAPNARHPDAPLMIDRDYYLRPEVQGRWIVATVPQDDGPCDVNDFEPDLHLFEEAIWEPLYHRAPGFDAVKVVRHWVGHYDYNTLDQNAILGPHPAVPNLFLMSGFSGHGLQQSPAIGRGTAEYVLNGGWQSLDLSELSIGRVLRGEPLLERAVV
ncbi:NAD(P)/FAD-dependent oxidoreductase [Fuscovulum blasticum]|uniref:NAD(P)/FAD-dependent oxidoreductase n=1 Tax=Fuscovulum blasticum TaxID=1075 RepID=UPI000D3E3EFF|nr:FAD-dependent oxidoreductase [Fuscovulum blasticum]AWD20575.1 amino acid oxidase [Fuscovulum blasticum]